jgi:hypothetical protein
VAGKVQVRQPDPAGVGCFMSLFRPKSYWNTSFVLNYIPRGNV